MDSRRLPLPGCPPTCAPLGAAEQAARAAQRALYASLPDGVLVVRDATIVFANVAAAGLLGAFDPQALLGRRVDALLGSCGPGLVAAALGREAHAHPPEVIEIEGLRLDGIGCVIEASVSVTRFDGQPAVQALLRDATARRLEQTLALRTRDVLEKMADGAPLGTVLRQVCVSIERMLGGSTRCAMLLLDGPRRRLLAGANGSLPAPVGARLRADDIGPQAGPCGRTAFHGTRVIVADLRTDPGCADLGAVCGEYGLRACWTTPVRDPDDAGVAGLLAVFHDAPQRPGARELDVADAFVRLAEEALRRSRLRERMRRDRLRHESVLQAVGAAVLVFRSDARLAGWNSGARRLLGLDDAALARLDADRLLDGAVAEDGSALSTHESPLTRCMRSREPQRERVIGLRTGDGSLRWVAANAYPVQTAPGEPEDDSVVCCLVDVGTIRATRQRLEQVARTDPLTGLPNRLFLQAEAARRAARAAREEAAFGALVMDLDGFKHVNDTLGHAGGDALLIDVAQRLQGALREGDVLARLGGDQFVVLTGPGTDARRLRALGRRLVDALAAPFPVGGLEVFVGASVGGALFPQHAPTPDALFRCADAAMYEAKRDGPGEVRLFGPGRAAPRINRIALDADLRHALRRSELALHYQPRWRAADGGLAGVEALLRWNHPVRGRLSPAEFVPIAEETGLIVPIGRWVIEEACRQHLAWRADGVAVASIAVNVSAAQFGTELFATLLPGLLDRFGVPPAALEIEITETVMMRRLDAAEAAAIEALRARGLRLLLDDFGTGYSSLSYLQRFPLDGLKIDRSFVSRLPDARDACAIVEAIVGLARSLSIVSIAEGVETETQAAWLRRAGCAELQGYLLGRPMPPEAIAALARERTDAARAALPAR